MEEAIVRLPKNWKYEIRRSISFTGRLKGINCSIYGPSRKREGGVQEYGRLSKDGTVTGFPGYRYDGPSGPTIDTPATIWASAFHDILYQMIREQLIPFRLWKEADNVLYDAMRYKGSSRTRSMLWWIGLRVAGGAAARPE